MKINYLKTNTFFYLSLFFVLGLFGGLSIFILTSFVSRDRSIFPENKSVLFSITATSSAPLSASEYETLEKKFVEMVDKENPRVALLALSEGMKKDTAISDACHPLAHSIGSAAIDKYKDFAIAMTYQDELCNSGYIHGVIEAYFQTTDITEAMHHVCEQFSVGTFKSWQCFHGIGHGLMLSSKNDLPRSLALCKTYPGHFISSACATGVFMQNFNVDDSPYTYLNDPLKTCRESPKEFQSECYINEPIYFLSVNERNYAAAFRHCENWFGIINHDCAQGVGNQLAKYNLSNLKEVRSFCVTSGRFRDDCIQGAATILIFQYGQLAPAREFCDAFDSKMKQMCNIQLNTALSQFNDKDL